MNKIEQIKFIDDNYPATKHHVSKRDIRHGFFKNIQTEIQAYLLGFYVADGSIDEKRKTFRIHLSECDEEIINLYKTFISKDARIFKQHGHQILGRQGQIYLQKNFIGIDITSQELVQSLVDLGFGYNKSYQDLSLPTLSDELIPHFIRGLFDGDGCITVWYVPENKSRKERVRAKFDIVQKKSNILFQIQKIFTSQGIESSVNYLKRDDMYRLSVGSKDSLEKIFKLLYSDANFYLTRKFNKFNHYVNTEVTQLIAEHRNAQKVSVNESNNPSTSSEHPTNEDENIC